MDSDQDLSECPLCLEALEADDLSFFPCTCCYQICRFCWHRIRTDENGLCPACRKPYSENPAQFKPLTEEEIQQVKRERKVKESNRKPKITESRKHLTNLRVVQRNLVFVNGLPSRLADTELLRRNDHFGKYGKIVKLVTSPAHNGQVNSICVYITYSRSDEALRAIQALCNYHVDGRTLKATLGTTKYCSRYLKGAVCQKTDCLYLHEPGDPSASFTKEQMQQGLHLDYERKLMEQFVNQTASGTPKSNRTLTNGHKNDSSQKRPMPLITPLLATSIDSNSNLSLANPDLESGDDTLTSSTAINVDTLNGDSDSSSTSSQTSSEHDPSSRTQVTTYHVSPSTTWPDQTATHLLSSNETIHPNSTVKQIDQLPEYKLFASNTPSIHTLFFGTNENRQQSLSNGNFDHQLEDLSKRLLETDFTNSNPPSFLQTQESDELGFDPCSLFMSALASDIEDERRPSSSSNTSHNFRSTSNSYGFPSQFNSAMPSNSSSWMMQQPYHPYHEQTTTPQKQQRYQPAFNGSSPRQMWNGTQQPQQYPSHMPTRLDFSNQIRQSSPASQYPVQSINPTDRWMNMSRTDPMTSQWSSTGFQGSSTLSSGNSLMSTSRWPPSSSSSQSHLFTNGMYMPYSATSTIDDGNRP